MGIAKHYLWLYNGSGRYFIKRKDKVASLIDRKAEIKKKGFNLRLATEDTNEKYIPVDFSKIKVGVKTLDDAVLSLG